MGQDWEKHHFRLSRAHFVPLWQTRQPVNILRDLITREQSRDCWGLLERAEFKEWFFNEFLMSSAKWGWLVRDCCCRFLSTSTYCSYLPLKWYQLEKYGITPLWGDMWMILESTAGTCDGGVHFWECPPIAPPAYSTRAAHCQKKHTTGGGSVHSHAAARMSDIWTHTDTPTDSTADPPSQQNAATLMSPVCCF